MHVHDIIYYRVITTGNKWANTAQAQQENNLHYHSNPNLSADCKRKEIPLFTQ